MYQAWCNGVTSLVRAYSKDNAIAYFQKLDENVKPEDVKKSDFLNTGSTIDEIAEEFTGEYKKNEPIFEYSVKMKA